MTKKEEEQFWAGVITTCKVLRETLSAAQRSVEAREQEAVQNLMRVLPKKRAHPPAAKPPKRKKRR